MLGVAPVKPVLIAASLLAAVTVVHAGAASTGLLAIATDGERTVTFVTPTPNFALAEKQSIHPQLKPEFRVEWNGFLKIPRAGEYTISGTPEIFVNATEANGVAMKLAAGEASLRVRFKRKEARARVQLRWQSEFFPIEPIPASAYSHETSPAASLMEEGRELVENLGCASCHKAGAIAVKERRGPVLSGVGSRLKPEWIYKWLAGPRTFRRDATMPVLLHTDEERTDVSAYLITLVATNSAWSSIMPGGDRGDAVFKNTGCVACHTDTTVPLFGVGSKYRDASALAAYLLKPLEVSPQGRMPDMLLKRDEANYLAEWLIQSRKESFESPFQRGDATRGQALVSERGCANCHTIQSVTSATAKDFEMLDAGRGCLAKSPSGMAARYALTERERAALIEYVKRPDKSEAPVQDFHRTVKQLNCRGCHELNGAAQFAFEVNQAPPPLTDSGNKLRPSWLEQVLLHRKRIRPWMELRMPHFATNQVGSLVQLFAAQAGAAPGDGERLAKSTSLELVQHGTKLIGRDDGGLSCINCHDFRGEPSGGEMRGPDMTEMSDRIRDEWLARWLRDPARIQPGTAMPAFFGDMPASEGEPKIAAIINALAAGKHMPTPAGLSESAQAYLLLVKDEPIVFRTFIQDSSPRSIAVGFPGLNSFVFDAQLCRLRYAWSGDFLDVKPVWSDRGGSQARILGAKYYTAPNVFPLRIGDPDSEPKVEFKGYNLLNKFPQFHYRVDGVPVREWITPWTNQLGIRRTFRLQNPGKDVWFIAPKPSQGRLACPNGDPIEGRVRIPQRDAMAFDVTVLAR
jgi:mono/diheme cytochrome c family protein